MTIAKATKPPERFDKAAIPETGSVLYRAQTRRTLAMAVREELRNQELQAQLVRREAVEREWFKLSRQVRDALFNIPDRLAGIVTSEKKQEKNHAHIEREIRQALEGLIPHDKQS